MYSRSIITVTLVDNSLDQDREILGYSYGMTILWDASWWENKNNTSFIKGAYKGCFWRKV